MGTLQSLGYSPVPWGTLQSLGVLSSPLGYSALRACLAVLRSESAGGTKAPMTDSAAALVIKVWTALPSLRDGCLQPLRLADRIDQCGSNMHRCGVLNNIFAQHGSAVEEAQAVSLPPSSVAQLYVACFMLRVACCMVHVAPKPRLRLVQVDESVAAIVAVLGRVCASALSLSEDSKVQCDSDHDARQRCASYAFTCVPPCRLRRSLRHRWAAL